MGDCGNSTINTDFSMLLCRVKLNFNFKKAINLMVECWYFVNIGEVEHGWRKVPLWFEAETSGSELSATHETV
ncbi:hypothetical protein E2C01_003071 [Portunus trituberculatus]|uniref:Uncharacterized protein n=1 Tax=Portunus trituberculatus TaxID=210409 RepID=A0A5B7CMP9_PORTR|nr:hypothetical protein [Portunus trituberculatus]